MTGSGHRRPIRSYVLRTGRMTPAQQRAFDEGWSRWGLEYGAGVPDFDAVFGGPGPRVLEIGFGMGQSLVAMAEAEPGAGFIGIEVHTPGVGKLLHTMAERQVHNIRVYRHDAVEVLRDCIPDACLDTIQIFFPDPWHKKRHHKRRLIQPDFVQAETGRHPAPGDRLGGLCPADDGGAQCGAEPGQYPGPGGVRPPPGAPSAYQVRAAR